MGQSSIPDVTMNKDYVEYEKQITEMILEALQIQRMGARMEKHLGRSCPWKRWGQRNYLLTLRMFTLCFFKEEITGDKMSLYFKQPFFLAH